MKPKLMALLFVILLILCAYNGLTQPPLKKTERYLATTALVFDSAARVPSVADVHFTILLDKIGKIYTHYTIINDSLNIKTDLSFGPQIADKAIAEGQHGYYFPAVDEASGKHYQASLIFDADGTLNSVGLWDGVRTFVAIIKDPLPPSSKL